MWCSNLVIGVMLGCVVLILVLLSVVFVFLSWFNVFLYEIVIWFNLFIIIAVDVWLVSVVLVCLFV